MHVLAVGGNIARKNMHTRKREREREVGNDVRRSGAVVTYQIVYKHSLTIAMGRANKSLPLHGRIPRGCLR